MKTLVSLLALLIASPASVVLAQGGFSITYSSCNLPGNIDRSYSCSTDPPQSVVVSSFHLDAPLPDFIGCVSLMDLGTPMGLPFPDWWKTAAGECREGLVHPANVALASGCSNAYTGTMGQGGSLDPDQADPYWRPNHRKLRISWSRAEPFALASGARYVATRLEIDGAGSDVCLGCSLPACIRQNQVILFGAAGATVYLNHPTMAEDNDIITWNRDGKVGPCEIFVGPVHDRTWGAIKTLYR
jgi:hypothetical protein